MNKQDVIQAITAIRKSKNITQRQLAEKTGIAQQTLSKIEQDGSNPQLDTLVSIADALNCDIIFTDRKDNNTIALTTNRDWLNACKQDIDNYQTGTVADLSKKIKKNDDIEDFEKHLYAVPGWINELEDKLWISQDLFRCVEACKDLMSIFGDKKNIVELDVINNIWDEVQACEETINEIASDLYRLSGEIEEVKAWVEEYL